MTNINILNCVYRLQFFSSLFSKVTRLIPDAKGTTCNQRLERVSGTEHTHILRVPFRSEKGILRKWISRFDVWPYLENYAQDAASEIVGELQGVPDFIIGNYSDGNLVASLMAHRMGVTQVRVSCCCMLCLLMEHLIFGFFESLI